MGQLWTRLNSDPTIRYRQRLLTGLYSYGLNLGQIQDGQESHIADIWLYHTFLYPIRDVVYWVEPTIINPYGGDFSPRSDHAEIILDGAADIGFAVEEDPDAVSPFASPIRPYTGFIDKKVNARLVQAVSMRLTDPQPESVPSGPLDGVIGESGNEEFGDSAHLKIKIDTGARGEHLLGRRMLGLRFAFTYEAPS
jgi:hypothetical protein